jgi:phosphotransferase system enzyme I (PtsI)
VFNDVEDPYLHERKGDLHDVAGRLRMNLRGEMGGARDLLQDLDSPCVLVADELTPPVVAQLDWTRILGFATDAGSRTYHTAILRARSACRRSSAFMNVSQRIPAGASVIIDGDSGGPDHRSHACGSSGSGGAHAVAAYARTTAAQEGRP